MMTPEEQFALSQAPLIAACDAVLEVFGPERYEEWHRVWGRRSVVLQREVVEMSWTRQDLEALPTTEDQT